jgi:hypothetical protein
MPFNYFQLNGSQWEEVAEMLERRFRRPQPGQTEPAPEFPEAEIDDAERRAAMTRERLRRAGVR